VVAFAAPDKQIPSLRGGMTARKTSASAALV
jgi:hypothetical protein